MKIVKVEFFEIGVDDQPILTSSIDDVNGYEEICTHFTISEFQHFIVCYYDLYKKIANKIDITKTHNIKIYLEMFDGSVINITLNGVVLDVTYYRFNKCSDFVKLDMFDNNIIYPPLNNFDKIHPRKANIFGESYDIFIKNYKKHGMSL